MAKGLRESEAVKKAVEATAEEAAAVLRKTLSPAMQRALDNMDIVAARFTAGPIAGLTATGKADGPDHRRRHAARAAERDNGQLSSSLITGAPIIGEEVGYGIVRGLQPPIEPRSRPR